MENKLKYGDSKTYKYELDKQRLDELTSVTNRSDGQTQFLFQLVDGDFRKLMLLESKIKTNHVGYCPGDKEEVEKILNL